MTQNTQTNTRTSALAVFCCLILLGSVVEGVNLRLSGNPSAPIIVASSPAEAAAKVVEPQVQEVEAVEEKEATEESAAPAETPVSQEGASKVDVPPEQQPGPHNKLAAESADDEDEDEKEEENVLFESDDAEDEAYDKSVEPMLIADTDDADEAEQLALFQALEGNVDMEDDEEVHDNAMDEDELAKNKLDGISGMLAYLTYKDDFRTGNAIHWDPKSVRGLKGHDISVVGHTWSDNGAQVNYVVYDKTDKVVYIVFRGTGTAENWKYNFRIGKVPCSFCSKTCKGCELGQGFQELFEQVKDKIRAAVKTLPHDIQYVVTGHSQGGALATLEAYDLAVNQGVKKVRLVALAGPRVGNPAFATDFNRYVTDAVRYVERFRLDKCPDQGWWGRTKAILSDVNIFRKYVQGDRSPEVWSSTRSSDVEVQEDNVLQYADDTDDDSNVEGVDEDELDEQVSDSDAVGMASQLALSTARTALQEHVSSNQAIGEAVDTLHQFVTEHNEHMAELQDMWDQVNMSDEEQVMDAAYETRRRVRRRRRRNRGLMSKVFNGLSSVMRRLRGRRDRASAGSRTTARMVAKAAKNTHLAAETASAVTKAAVQEAVVASQTSDQWKAPEPKRITFLGMPPLEALKVIGEFVVTLKKRYEAWRDEYKNKPYVEGVDIVSTVPYRGMGYRGVGTLKYLHCARSCNEGCKCRTPINAAAFCHDPKYYADDLDKIY